MNKYYKNTNKIKKNRQYWEWICCGIEQAILEFWGWLFYWMEITL